jgi:Tol biopolymer transport system component
MFRYELSLPAGVDFSALAAPSLAVSPQGTHIAVAAAGAIYLRAMDDEEAVLVRGTDTFAFVPFFSPDGQWLGFFAEGELRKVAISGGSAQKLADIAGTNGATWGADGTILYATDAIYRVSSDGGEPQVVFPAAENMSYLRPTQLPDGSILFTMSGAGDSTWDDGRIVVQAPGEDEPTLLVSGGRDARYLPTGHIVYALEDAILARTFDIASREVGGAVPLLEGVAGAAGASGSAHFGVSDNGDLVYIAGGNSGGDRATFVVHSPDGGIEIVADANDVGRTWTPRLSPDGRYVAYRVTGGSSDNIWMLDLQRGIHSLFTPDGDARSFAWSPQGEFLYYSADTEDGVNIYRRPADMRSDAEEFLAGEGNQFVRSISADGEWLVFADTDVINTGAYDIKVMSLTEPGDPQPMFDREEQEVTASISPNGRWVAYVSGPPNGRRVFVQGFPNLGGITQVSDGVGSEPVWADDSSKLFYRTLTDIMAVDVVSEDPFDISAPRLYLSEVLTIGETQNAGSYDVWSDGESLLMVDWTGGQAGDSGSYRVVLNWFKELNERVPAGGQ